MNFNAKTLLTLLAVFAVVGSSTAAAAGLGLNPSAEQYPTTYFSEDELTIESHDRGSMDWLQYENDNGNIATIDAHVNGTDSGATVSYRADQLKADAFAQFPRVDGEENNTATWLNTSNWTSQSNVSITDTDGTTASGVPSVQVATDGTLGSGSSTHVAYAKPEISSDVQKRYLQLVLNVESLEGDLAVQVRDGGGDYVEAVVNSSRDATAGDVIANLTGDGIIYQEQLGQLSVAGSGDGTLDAIEEGGTEDGDPTDAPGVLKASFRIAKFARGDTGERSAIRQGVRRFWARARGATADLEVDGNMQTQIDVDGPIEELYLLDPEDDQPLEYMPEHHSIEFPKLLEYNEDGNLVAIHPVPWIAGGLTLGMSWIRDTPRDPSHERISMSSNPASLNTTNPNSANVSWSTLSTA